MLRWLEPKIAALASVALTVTEAPWQLVHPGTLTDDELLHAVALAAYFGHLNRIADAVAVPLDYPVMHAPPHAEPAVPAFVPAPFPVAAGSPRLSLAQRPATAEKLADWAAYAFDRDTAQLSRARRARIRRHVEDLVGMDSGTSFPADDLDRDLLALTDVVTRAPWKIDTATYAPLRARGFDDAALFDACVVATTAGVTARIDVALAALAR